MDLCRTDPKSRGNALKVACINISNIIETFAQVNPRGKLTFGDYIISRLQIEKKAWNRREFAVNKS